MAGNSKRLSKTSDCGVRPSARVLFIAGWPAADFIKHLNSVSVKPAAGQCARITSRDRNGREILGNFREIGAVWAPNPEKKWYPVALDLTPQELLNGKRFVRTLCWSA